MLKQRTRVLHFLRFYTHVVFLYFFTYS